MKSRLGFVVKMGISVGIFALIAARTDLAKIGSILAAVGSGAVAAALVLIVSQTVITAYRWVVVMRGVDVSIEFWPALQAAISWQWG